MISSFARDGTVVAIVIALAVGLAGTIVALAAPFAAAALRPPLAALPPPGTGSLEATSSAKVPVVSARVKSLL
jgi:hypothetical protein